MEATLIKDRYKTAIIANAIFFAVMMLANPIAQSMDWVPAQDLVRQARVRVQRSGRRVRELFD